MFVHSLWSCDEDLIKQKVKIIDFQTISNSIDYGSFDIKCKKLNLMWKKLWKCIFRASRRLHIFPTLHWIMRCPPIPSRIFMDHVLQYLAQTLCNPKMELFVTKNGSNTWELLLLIFIDRELCLKCDKVPKVQLWND